jgi:hypothetical protein
MKTALRCAALLLCAALAAFAGEKKDEAPDLAHLEDSIAPLREAFNAGWGRPRFIALLSPT